MFAFRFSDSVEVQRTLFLLLNKINAAVNKYLPPIQSKTFHALEFSAINTVQIFIEKIRMWQIILLLLVLGKSIIAFMIKKRSYINLHNKNGAILVKNN